MRPGARAKGGRSPLLARLLRRLDVVVEPWRRSPWVGVEVTASAIRAVWRLPQADGHATWRLTQQRRSEAASTDALRAALEQVLGPRRWHRATARLCLAAPSSVVHSLTVRVPDAARIPEAVREQLPQLLPFTLEQAQVAFRVRRQQPADDALECLLSLGACEAARLTEVLEALWQLGWSPRVVIPAAEALAQAARALGMAAGPPALLVEVGEGQTTIAVLDEGEVSYGRDVALGTDHLIDALVVPMGVGGQQVQLSRAQAETLLWASGVPDMTAARPEPEPAADGGATPPPALPPAIYTAMIQPVLEQFVEEMRRTMAFTAQVTRASAPKRLLLSGPGSTLPAWDRWLERRLELPVARLTCEPLLGPAGAIGAVSSGLALCERRPKLDLQPRTWRSRGATVRLAVRTWQTLVVTAALFWTGAGVWQARRLGVQRQLQALAAQGQPRHSLVTLHERITLLEARDAHLRAEQGAPIEWFHRLASGFPDPIRLTELTMGHRQVRLTGEAQQRQQSPEAHVSELTLWLERARLCDGARLDASRRTDSAQGLVSFVVTCQVPNGDADDRGGAAPHHGPS